MMSSDSSLGARPKGWFTYSLKRGWKKTQSSFLIAVVIVGVVVNLMSNAISGQRLPLPWFILLLVIVAVFYVVSIVRGARLLPRTQPGTEKYHLMSEDELKQITDIVTVVPGPAKDSDVPDTKVWDKKPMGDFCRAKGTGELPNLQAIHLVIACSDALELWRETVQEFSADRMDDEKVDMPILGYQPDRFAVREEDIAELEKSLRLCSETVKMQGRILYVDITADTKPMTVTLFLAAQAAGLPVTYKVQPDHQQNGSMTLYQITSGQSPA